MNQTPSPDRQVLSVSSLNGLAKELLENLPALWVEGEISNFTCPSSGHWYFTLKDSKAQVRCAMFRNRNAAVRFKPTNGHKVTLLANVSLYAERGEYQLIVDRIEQSGEGLLRLAFEKLKAQLQQEGLFDPQYKQEIPAWVQHVGVITSPSGAAIHDILTVLKRRFPAIAVSILPVAVQGKEAAQQIAQAIALANTHTDCDVLIVGRGGGSLEDLWSFNEEVVARAIFASRIPIISAVGHEVDFSIADFVADVRAPTPSAAAELISSNHAEVSALLTRFYQRAVSCVSTHLQHQQRELENLFKRLRSPTQILQAQAQTLDHLELRIKTALTHQLHTHRNHLAQIENQLAQQAPIHQLNRINLRTHQLTARLTHHMYSLLKAKQYALSTLMQQLDIVSPLATLDRGYALVTDAQHHLVRHHQQVKKGDTIIAKVAQGSIECTVERTHK